MIFDIKSTSDASVVFTHGWPRARTHHKHQGFLLGNITCMSRASNTRIRSLAKGDVASFVSTEEISAAGLTLSNLLYCRKASIQCEWQKYVLPTHLVNQTIQYMINFQTMAPLQTEEMSQFGMETFIPYWKQIFTPDSDTSTGEESTCTSPESDGENFLRVSEPAMKSMFRCAEDVQRVTAASTLRRSFLHAPLRKSITGHTQLHPPPPPNDDPNPDPGNSG